MEEKRRLRTAVRTHYVRQEEGGTRTWFKVTAYTEVRKFDTIGRERGTEVENATELDLSMAQASALLYHLADQIGSMATYDDDRLAKLAAQGVNVDF